MYSAGDILCSIVDIVLKHADPVVLLVSANVDRDLCACTQNRVRVSQFDRVSDVMSCAMWCSSPNQSTKSSGSEHTRRLQLDGPDCLGATV